jgi:hypothetical protein
MSSIPDPARTAELQRMTKALHTNTDPRQRVALVQRYIAGFTYNKTLSRHFHTTLDRPLSMILETARYILHGIFHIRCVEAVFAGIALTQPLREVERYPLRWKTTHRATETLCKHMVLAVRIPATPCERGRPPQSGPWLWGCVGLSRELELMNKECRFRSLHELIENFMASYDQCGHDVLR